MGTIAIRRLTVSEVETAESIETLTSEYADECAIAGLLRPDPQWSIYHAFEDCGILSVLGAFDDDRLIGAAFVLTTTSPHYGVPLSVTESIFILKQYRTTGIGRKLINACLDLSHERGAHGFFMSAPFGGSLEKILPRASFRQTNAVFFKGLR